MTSESSMMSDFVTADTLAFIRQVPKVGELLFLCSTYPDPLPPTMATFFPAGTVNDSLLRICRPSTYLNITSSNVMVAVSGLISSSGAPGRL